MESPHVSQSSSSASDTHATVPKNKTPEKKEGVFSEMVRFSLMALLIVLPIRLYIAQPFIVSGASMESTFSTGEYLIVDQLTYHFEEPKRGDVIIFRYPKDTTKFYIKRIIGMPGDTISIVGKTVTITNAEHPDGIELKEPYILDMKPGATVTEVLGEGDYFVMGDNRNHSSDSRMWGIVKDHHIIGRAFLRLFPITKLGTFPGEYDIESEIQLAK